MKTTNQKTQPDNTPGGAITPESNHVKERAKTSPFVVAAICLLTLAVGVQGFFLTTMYLDTGDAERKVASLTLPEKLLKPSEKPMAKGEAAAETEDIPKAGEGLIEPDKPWQSLFSNQWDPFKEMSDLQERMNKLFEHRYNGLTPSPALPKLDDWWSLNHAWSLNNGGKDMFSLGSEIRDEDHAVVVTLDLPDIDEDSLDIRFEDGVLSVSGRQDKMSEQLNDMEQVVGRSRSVSSFSRKFTIPADVNAAAMRYEVLNGKLRITLPKVD
ncbi:MAG: Hsp20/alpha crystallin family protein [Akkermansiaceae bacterium]|nr:Hsp20/alpha crystallin family protein [Akkermansiaceae bacterium]